MARKVQSTSGKSSLLGSALASGIFAAIGAFASVGTVRADVAPVAACKIPTGPITVGFNSRVGLKDLIAWAHSFTCKTFVFDDSFGARNSGVSIVASQAMSLDEAQRVFNAALTEMHFVAVADGDIVRIHEAGKIESPVAAAGAIKKVSESHYEISRSVVSEESLQAAADAGGARFVPSLKDGKPNGFKLYAIKPDSMFAKLGLQNGDTIQAINGTSVSSADSALDVYVQLRDAKELQVSLLRRGSVITLFYTIR